MFITNIIKNGNKIAYYEVADSYGNKRNISKEQVVNLVQNKQIENATVQIYKGNAIVRIKDTRSIAAKHEKRSKHSLGPFYGESAIKRLSLTEVGTPLKIDTKGNVEDVIYLGKEGGELSPLSTRFLFFNGEGISGYFGFSANFIINNSEKMKFEFNKCKPEEVASLLRYLKEGPWDESIKNLVPVYTN